jgi:hypothetical protein
MTDLPEVFADFNGSEVLARGVEHETIRHESDSADP